MALIYGRMTPKAANPTHNGRGNFVLVEAQLVEETTKVKAQLVEEIEAQRVCTADSEEEAVQVGRTPCSQAA